MKQDLKYLKPADGRLVRDPLTMKALPAEGAFVDMGDARENHTRRMHFTRLLRNGDVVEAKPPAKAPAKK